MITGTNPSTGIDVQYNQFSDGPKNYTDPDSVFESLVARRDNIEKGGVNCIPLPFERFRSEVPGVEQGQYVVLTASTKVKS